LLSFLSILLLLAIIGIRICVSKSLFDGKTNHWLLSLNSIFAKIIPLIWIYLFGEFYKAKNKLQRRKKPKKRKKKYLFRIKENVMENIIKVLIVLMGISSCSAFLFHIVSAFLPIDENLSEEIFKYLLIVSFVYLFLFFLSVFIASKAKITPTTNPKVKEKLKKKMEAEIFPIYFTHFNEMILDFEKKLHHKNYQKYSIENVSFKENFVYVQQKEFRRIECIFIAHLEELNDKVINELDKKVASFIYKKFPRIDFLETKNIFWVDKENTYFDHYLNNGVAQPFRICSLIVGVLPEKQQIYITKNKTAFIHLYIRK